MFELQFWIKQVLLWCGKFRRILQIRQKNTPELWNLFFKSLFHLYNKSENQRLKALTIFQVSCYSENNSTMKTSLHDSIGQSVHEIDSSK